MTITKLAPEQFDVANAYLQYGTVETTAEMLQVPTHVVVKILKEPEIKTYLNSIYLDLGYRNRNKLGALLDKMIDAKIEEAEDSGIYTKKDLLELITLAHKMRMDEIKAEQTVTNTVNIANIGQDTAYGRLMQTLLPGDPNVR
jgi:hypothetical protein